MPEPKTSWYKLPSVRLALALLVVILAFVVWNGRLLWSISKPEVVTLFNKPTPVPSPVVYSTDEFIYSRLGIEAPLHENANNSPLRVQDWNKIAQDLRSGVALSFDTANFIDSARVYVTGHSSDTYPHQYSSVFAALGQAKVGDSFTIALHGVGYQYKVIDTYVAAPTDLQAFQPKLTDPKEREAVVVTCWPLLTSVNRKVVVGQQVASQ